MITKLKVYKDLPFLENKIYRTRFQTGDLFYITKIKTKVLKIENEFVERIIGFEGIYENNKQLGVCPLAVDRLIPEQIEDGFKYVCDCCKTEIKLSDLKNLK